VVKCTICGAAAMSGAMLCRPCRAALKRARYVSVQVMPPSSVMQARSARPRRGLPSAPHASPAGSPAEGKAVKRRTEVPLSAQHAWVRELVMGGVAVLALGTIAWFGQPADLPAATTVAAALKAPAATVVEVAAPAALPTPAITDTTITRTTDAPARVAAPAIGAASGAEPSVRKVEVRAATARPAALPASDGATAMLSTGPGVEGFGLDAAPLPPVAVPAPPVITPPPAPRDRWQMMGDQLARCDREGGITGFICDQRVRIESCEGYWGRVPQCPLPPENPR